MLLGKDTLNGKTQLLYGKILGEAQEVHGVATTKYWLIANLGHPIEAHRIGNRRNSSIYTLGPFYLARPPPPHFQLFEHMTILTPHKSTRYENRPD